jgi:hypothetical protein
MPCYTTVRTTKILSRADLVDALKALGYTIEADSETSVIARQLGGVRVGFSRSAVGQPFTTPDDFVGLGIARKASEMTVRRVQRKFGMLVGGVEEIPQRRSVRITFNDRRG